MFKVYKLDDAFFNLFTEINKSSFFMNRMGGSDIMKYCAYMSNKNKASFPSETGLELIKHLNTEIMKDYSYIGEMPANHGRKEKNIDNYIYYLSEWNGYYDKSIDPNIRKLNVERYFRELYAIYNNNLIIASVLPQMSTQLMEGMNLSNSNFISYVEGPEKLAFLKYLLNFYKGQKMLIVSPFVEQIREQINKFKINKLHDVNNIEFIFLKSYITYFNPDTRDYHCCPHSNFFETVEYYKDCLNKMDFDVALLSCGTYAHFIGDYIKNINKKAIYVGSIIQLWFGIYGNKWLDKGPMYYDGLDLNNCILNTYDANYSDKTIESLNSYCYNEKRWLDKLKTFNYDEYRNLGYNYIGAKIHYLCKKL